MRVACFLLIAALALSGCSMFGGDRASSSEDVRTAYAGPAALDEQQVTRLLHDQGYSNISGLHKNGSDWIGAATTKTGAQVDFDMDKNGVIHTK
jgi:hypothetical protein